MKDLTPAVLSRLADLVERFCRGTSLVVTLPPQSTHAVIGAAEERDICDSARADADALAELLAALPCLVARAMQPQPAPSPRLPRFADSPRGLATIAEDTPAGTDVLVLADGEILVARTIEAPRRRGVDGLEVALYGCPYRVSARRVFLLPAAAK